MTTRTWLLVFLMLNISSLALLAMFYLRKCRLPWAGYLFWGMVALIPIIGPFVVFLSRPGRD